MRWDTLLEGLHADPLLLVSVLLLGVVTCEDVEYITIRALYFPLDQWLLLGQSLGDFMTGNGMLAHTLAHPASHPPLRRRSKPAAHNYRAYAIPPRRPQNSN